MWTRLFSAERRAVERVLAGDREAFGVIVERYFGAVKAFAYSRVNNVQDAEDIAQETFLNAYRSLASLQNPAKIGAWLLAIAANVSKTVLAARQRRERWGGAPDAEPSEVSDPGRDELHALLRREVDALDEKYRDVLVLHYFAGQTTKVIAGLLGISRDAAQKRLQRGREQLGERLVSHLGDALAPYSGNDDEKRRTLKAVLALPPLHVPSSAIPAPAAPMPAGVYVGVGAVGIAVIGGLTWFNAHDARSLNEPSQAQARSYESAAVALSIAAETHDANAAAAPAKQARDGFVIGGSVTTVDGEPIAGAIVRGYSVGAAIPETRTNAEGTFALDGLPPRAYRVRVIHDDYIGAWIPDVPAGRTDVAFLLEAYPSLTVQVVDAFDDRPIERFFYTDPKSGETRESLDGDGTFAIHRVMPGKSVGIVVWADDYRIKQTAILMESTHPDTIRLPLDRATVINGRVLAANGNPVANAQVAGAPTSRHYTTARDGSFRIETPHGNPPSRIFAAHGEEGFGYVDVESDSSAWEIDVELHLQTAGAIEITFDGNVPGDSHWLGGLQYTDRDIPEFFVWTDDLVPLGMNRMFNMKQNSDETFYFGPLLPGKLEIDIRGVKAFTGLRPTDVWGLRFRDKVLVEAGKTSQIRFNIPDTTGRLVVTLPRWLVDDSASQGMSLTLSLDGGRVSQDRNVRLEHGAAYLDNLAVGPASVTAILHTSSATYNTTMPVQIDADSDSTLDLAFDTTTGIRIVDGSRVPAALPISIIESPLDSSPFPSRYAFQVSFTGSAYGLVPGEYRLRYYVPTQGGRFSYETDYVEWSVDVVAGHVVEVVPPAS